MDAKLKSLGTMDQFFGATSNAPSTSMAPKDSVESNSSVKNSSTLAFSGKEVLDAEITWALKCVNSHYSMNSCEGIASIFTTMFPDSNIAKQFSCGPTKCAYLICFGLAPYFKSALFKYINELDHYSILFDESLNLTTQSKQMDIHVRFWDAKEDIVRTKYYTSVFMGHSTAEDTLLALHDAMCKLNLAKVLNLSMDGPAVNWKVFTLLQKEIKEAFNTSMINVDSCSLHTLNNCLRSGYKSTSWEIDSFLISLHWLFKDCPARRDDYLNTAESTKMPQKFCKHRWLENAPATERAIEMWEDIKNYVNAVKNKKYTKPNSKSYQIVEEACEDILMPIKLNCFLSVVKILQPFLSHYQKDSPLLPFLADDLKKIVLDCLRTFNVMKNEKLLELTTAYKVSLFDFTDKTSYSCISKVSMGFVGDRLLKELKFKNKISERQMQELKHECQSFIYTLVHNMVTKSPIKNMLVRNLSCLDPRCMVSDSHGCYVKMKRVLSILSDCKKIQEEDCDSILLEFQEFLNSVLAEPLKFHEFDRYNSRLDLFLLGHLNQKRFEKLWCVVKMLLIISHGQATVERGFSSNRQIEVENLQEESFVAKRLIVDEIKCCGGLKNFVITKELRIAAAGARQKYLAHLEEQHKKKREETEKRKRKRFQDELADLESKKACIQESVDLLKTSADELAEKAEKTRNIQFITQSNSFRRTAKEKSIEVQKLKLQIANLLTEYGK